MKKLLLLCLLSVTSFHIAQAQTWDEWFKQKKTQRKYLLQQIVALKVYFGYVKKGYDIASKGLNTIRNIKNGDFNLHKDFFGSLKAVNPKIRNYGKVADIISFQLRIIKESRLTVAGVREAGQFTAEEMDYCKKVFDNLLNETLKTIDELFILITSGKLEMKDDERLKRIDALYADIQDKYAFTASFSEEMALLSVHRMRDQYEIDLSQKLFGLE